MRGRTRRAFIVLADAYIKNNRLLLTLCTAVILVSIAAGSVYCVMESTKGTLGDALKNIGTLKNIQDSGAVFLTSAASMAESAVIIWLCGCTKIGIPVSLCTLSVRGFVCGFCIAAFTLIYGMAGLAASAAGFALHMTFLFILMEILCVGAIKQSVRLSETNDARERGKSFLSYCTFCIIVTVCMLFCALYESYVSPKIIVWILKL